MANHLPQGQRRKEAAALRRALHELKRQGMLLASDSVLPSVAGFVAEAPLRGSVWAHPQAHAIFRINRRLASSPGVLSAKLINGKTTLVSQRLWTSLTAVGKAREPWQMQGLSSPARSLLLNVARKGALRTDQLARALGVAAKNLGDCARVLESRLLVYAESVHTESGFHAKRLESWKHLMRRKHLRASRITAAARKNFEKIAAPLETQFRVPVRLPWKKK